MLGARGGNGPPSSERAATHAFDVLGCLPPSVEPLATAHIPQIVSLITDLIAAGLAYPLGRRRVLRGAPPAGLRIPVRAEDR